ncbi:hypothetical protein M408DRAFT_11343 [Serendipita vermifera MAFF 305830]|uniref:NB-ARC domain-containing protein n=1 Tax=Serendipita vermifera MAFF 305830 TaxID=933852 RepID=A0A0C3AGI2_SERVB|nr:hypothetical protein M408DRAFT_11343 [Serendipita vermifera MAFF 305830]
MEAATHTAQETEETAENLQRRLETLDIYFRFSVERIIGKEYVNLETHFETITAHTRKYLTGDIIDGSFDSYMKVSHQTSAISLDRILWSRVGDLKSSHELPPLTAFFIMRAGPMKEITTALARTPQDGPAMAIVTGLGGAGKTQISLKYAYENEDSYDHILFVDTSSTESLEKTAIARIKSIDRQLHPLDWDEARDLLENPTGNLTRNWLMIMDNADDAQLDLRDYIPRCEHGCVLITGRNVALGNLDPDGHVLLDVMSRAEAIEALLSAALGPIISTSLKASRLQQPVSTPRTDKDYECAALIVEELGYLPLAVIQAACYIKQHKCLHDYLALLKTSRSSILRWPASVQHDKLKYAHSTYAAFDTTLGALSPRALQLLGIISFVHFSDFPRSLIAVAASTGFGYQYYDLLPRDAEYQSTISLLHDIFCPRKRWDQVELDILLEELQNYSLVTLVLVSGVITLRFHPLLHGWANDRLSNSERGSFRAAAIRLIACGTNKDDIHLRSLLSPHMERFSLTTEDLHVNDRAALAEVLISNGQTSKVLTIWQEIYAIMEAAHGKEDIRTTRAALELANAYGNQNDWDQMISMEREVVRIRASLLGSDHLETLQAMANLARSCKMEDELVKDAEDLELRILRVRKEVLGPNHRDIADALCDLATTRMQQGSYDEAQSLLTEASTMLTALLGKTHVATIKAMRQRAKCYKRSGDRSKEIQLKKEIFSLIRTTHGDAHTNTLRAMAKVAKVYHEQGQYQESEKMWRRIADGNREILGSQHEETLTALQWLAHSLFGLERFSESAALYKEVATAKQAILGAQHAEALDAMEWVADAYLWQEHYIEAEQLARKIIAERQATDSENQSPPLEALDILVHSTYQQGRLEEAKELWTKVVKLKGDLLGEDHEHTLGALCWLGIVNNDLGQCAEAEACFKAVLTGRRKTVGNQHMQTVEVLDQLVHVVYNGDKYAEAEELWREIVMVKRNLHGEQHEETLGAMFWLGFALEGQEKYAETEAIWREVAAIRRVAFGEHHSSTLDALFWLGYLFQKQGRYSESESMLKEVVATRQATLGDQHEDTLNAKEFLAQTQQAMADSSQKQGGSLGGR